MFDPGNLGLESVDFADIKFDVVTGRGIAVQLSLGVLGAVGLLTLDPLRTVGAGRTARTESTLRLVPLGH